MSPASRGMLQLVPEPLLAGVMGGLGLLCVALLLIIGVACVFRRRSAKRKRRDGKETQQSSQTHAQKHTHTHTHTQSLIH